MGREHQRFGTWVVGLPNQSYLCGKRNSPGRRAGAAGSEEDEAAADAEGCGFGAGGGSEFAEDSGYVEFGGVGGDLEAGGDLFIGEGLAFAGLLAHTAGASGGSGFLCRSGLRAWHCVGCSSRQVRDALLDYLLNGRKRGGQIRNRLVRLFEIKSAG